LLVSAFLRVMRLLICIIQQRKDHVIVVIVTGSQHLCQQRQYACSTGIPPGAGLVYASGPLLSAATWHGAPCCVSCYSDRLSSAVCCCPLLCAVSCCLLPPASWLLVPPPPPPARAHTQSTALFLFPTKALAQDQLRVLRQLLEDAFGPAAAAAAAGGGSAAAGTAAAAAGGDWVPPVDVYDGDTPQECRPAIRARAQLLITNPDMLHQAILPCHTNFERLLKNLTYVVVDEVGRVGGGEGGESEEVGKRGQWGRQGGGGREGDCIMGWGNGGGRGHLNGKGWQGGKGGGSRIGSMMRREGCGYRGVCPWVHFGFRCARRQSVLVYVWGDDFRAQVCGTCTIFVGWSQTNTEAVPFCGVCCVVCAMLRRVMRTVVCLAATLPWCCEG
jgi:hypothetical protein